MFWFVLFLVLHPFVLIAARLGLSAPPSSVSIHILEQSTGFTVAQALASAVLCVLLGLWAAPQYAALGARSRLLGGAWRRAFVWTRGILLLPNVMSPVLVVLCLLTSIRDFPFGWGGILIGHVFFNAGLAVVWLGESWLEIASGYAGVSEGLGAGQNHFVRRVVLPLLRPQLITVFWIIFSLCLASFFIPLVLGGSPRFYTLEALIYDKIRAEADVSGALLFAGLQIILQLAALLVTFSAVARGSPSRLSARHAGFVLRAGKLPVLGAIVAFSLYPMISLVQTSFGARWDYPKEGLVKALLFSGVFSILVGISVVAVLIGSMRFKLHPQSILLPSVSGVLAGLAGFILFGTRTQTSMPYLMVALVLAELTTLLPFMVRLSYVRMKQLKEHYGRTAMQLGASGGFLTRRVLIPLASPLLANSFLLSFCWVIGDAGVVSLLAPPESTLTLFIYSLQGSYRLEDAAAVSLVLLSLSFVGLIAFEGISDGLGQKSPS